MGRRIPKSRKHKKIKAIDPFYRGERKTSDKEDKKHNAKPLNPDEQEVPKKIKEIMDSKNTLNKFKRKRKKKIKLNLEYNEGDEYGPGVMGCTREPQPLPKFQQMRGESDQSFIHRIQMGALSALTQAKLESKFGVSFSEVEEGKVEYDKTTTLDVNNTLPMRLKKVTTTNKKLKRKKLKDAKKEKKLAMTKNRKGDFDHLKDEIKFGVVVDRPPTLSVLPRKAAANSKSKPGKRSLLLNKLLPSTTPNSPSSLDFSKRRKYLSVAVRRKLDTERDRVVQAYRELKSKQFKAAKT